MCGTIRPPSCYRVMVLALILVAIILFALAGVGLVPAYPLGWFGLAFFAAAWAVQVGLLPR